MNRQRVFAFVAMLAVGLVAGTHLRSLRSDEKAAALPATAIGAKKKHEARLKELAGAYEKAKANAQAEFIRELDDAMKSATKAGDLDAALAVRELKQLADEGKQAPPKAEPVVLPVGPVEFGKHRYLAVLRPGVKWTEVRDLCNKMGGDLATANSADEFKFLITLNGPTNLWIGATRVGNAWKWVDGAPVDAALWFNGKPKETPEEIYVYLNGVQSIWNHVNQSDTTPGFICEWSK